MKRQVSGMYIPDNYDMWVIHEEEVERRAEKEESEESE